MKYMLDTNICIYAIKNKPPEVIRNFLQHDPDDMCISSITYGELMHGVEKSQAVSAIHVNAQAEFKKQAIHRVSRPAEKPIEFYTLGGTTPTAPAIRAPARRWPARRWPARCSTRRRRCR